MEIPVIYEDDSLLAIDKPAGIVVNRAESVAGLTIQDWVDEKLQIKNEQFKIAETDFYERSGIVHRLDKDTSGLLLIAKTPLAFAYLQSQFKLRQVKKTYRALVHGILEPAEGEIRANVGRLPWNRQRFGVIAGGRIAITEYKVIARYQLDRLKYSLLDLTPQTGRTHQIRIHLKYVGHPIVTDQFYAGRKVIREDLKFCPRLFLHARELTFISLAVGKKVTVKSGLPGDLQAVLTHISHRFIG